MKALTISQPFASLIADGSKWVENRTWETLYRGPLAIHAGKGTQYLDKEELAEYPSGCVVAVAKLTACFHVTSIRRNASMGWRGDEAKSTGRSWLTLSEHTHTEGPFCWVLTDVEEIEPIHCRGAQGLWTLTPEIARQLRTTARKSCN